jgi:hypothetical protein
MVFLPLPLVNARGQENLMDPGGAITPPQLTTAAPVKPKCKTGGDFATI